MTTPIVYSNVKFERPFTVRGMRNHQAPGTYSIETKESFRWLFPFSWKRIALTKICSRKDETGDAHVLHFECDPREVFSAMERDRMASVAAASHNEPQGRGLRKLSEPAETR